eukprot:CAMPEP_0114417378 /NCGR_PEP_ID=MMETSP0103-20121206/2931_1 /TAXON_ID=37642 ORGANISM="Paraphysomonas imperforata, Strain PA2" /NCGR_SAMPLE_ID=MMETSP0103 /ASSEMBLY_ACC=CAM_ASM_000201 /LENGTH=539 /DNA_ID=CAMNT_0001585665 /DNA_START=54 /DNA_END=1673 /DNA_ORIENTATION=-
MTSKADRKRRRRISTTDCVENDVLIFDDIMTFKEEGDIDRCANLLKRAYASGDSDLRAQACYELALLNCQMGNHQDADMFLRQLGYRYKLSKNIWKYDSLEPLSSAGAPGVVRCHDNVLPPELLRRLCQIFSADSPFWTEHDYPSDGFFSYNVPLSVPKCSADEKSCYSDLMQQLGQYLQPLVSATFPDLPVKDATSIEWWAHTRTSGASAGHRLHYDLDELFILEHGELSEEVHPFVSSVLYLDDGGSSGAPTLVTNQSVLQNVYYDESECSGDEDSKEELEEEEEEGVRARNEDKGGNENDNKDNENEEEIAWLCPPKTNRLLLFDGSLMHGVVPHLRKDKDAVGSKSPRVTLMIGWWGPHVTTTDSPTIHHSSRRDRKTLTNLQPNMAMPSMRTNTPLARPLGRKKKRQAPDTSLRWPELFEVDTELSQLIETKQIEYQQTLSDLKSSCELIKVAGGIWEEVAEGTSNDSPEVIESNMDFLGNWFLRSRSEILDAVERTCVDCRHRNEVYVTSSGEATEVAVEWMSVEELKRLRGD